MEMPAELAIYRTDNQQGMNITLASPGASNCCPSTSMTVPGETVF